MGLHHILSISLFFLSDKCLTYNVLFISLGPNCDQDTFSFKCRVTWWDNSKLALSHLNTTFDGSTYSRLKMSCLNQLNFSFCQIKTLQAKEDQCCHQTCSKNSRIVTLERIPWNRSCLSLIHASLVYLRNLKTVSIGEPRNSQLFSIGCKPRSDCKFSLKTPLASFQIESQIEVPFL